MAKVLKEFRDAKNFAKVYKVGDEVDFSTDAERWAKLVKLGLVEGVKAEKAKTPEKQ